MNEKEREAVAEFKINILNGYTFNESLDNGVYNIDLTDEERKRVHSFIVRAITLM